MHHLVFIGSDPFSAQQLEILKKCLTSSSPNIVLEVYQSENKLSRILNKCNPIESSFILFSTHKNSKNISQFAHKLQNLHLKYIVYHLQSHNLRDQFTTILLQLQVKLKQMIQSQNNSVKFSHNQSGKVNLCIVKSKNCKFKQQSEQLYHRFKNDTRVSFTYVQDVADYQFILNSQSTIIVVHSYDIQKLNSSYRNLIAKVPYGKLTVIVYNEGIAPSRFKFDFKVKNYRSMLEKIQQLLEESISNMQIKKCKYKIVVLDGDAIFKQFYKLLPYKYLIQQQLKKNAQNCIVISPSSKVRQLSKYLQLCPSSIGIISTIESCPEALTSCYYHLSIKLVTNKIKQCISYISRLNQDSEMKSEKYQPRHKFTYNPAKANMWQKLQNQLRNQVQKKRRDSLQRCKSSISNSTKTKIIKKQPQSRMCSSPNQEYFSNEHLNLLTIGKKHSNQPSTKINSILPSEMIKNNENKNMPEIHSYNAQKSNHKRICSDFIFEPGLSFHEVSNIPQFSIPSLKKGGQLEPNDSNIFTLNNKCASNRQGLSNISNKINQQFTKIHLKQTKLLPGFTLGPTQISHQIKEINFPSHSEHIQIFFKTSHPYINNLFQFFSQSSKFYYKYQNMNQLKNIMRNSHQQMVTLAIIDDQQMAQTTRMMAVFDHIYYLVVVPSIKINNLQNAINKDIGLIPEQAPLQKSFKDINQYLRFLRIKHFTKNNSNFNNFFDQELGEELLQQFDKHIFYYFQNQKYIPGLLNSANLQVEFSLRKYKNLQQLQQSIKKIQIAKGLKIIVILTGYIASKFHSIINTRKSNIKYVIFEPNKFLQSSKCLSIPLVSTEWQLIKQIKKLLS